MTSQHYREPMKRRCAYVAGIEGNNMPSVVSLVRPNRILNHSQEGSDE
jgi:hypothetical protein